MERVDNMTIRQSLNVTAGVCCLAIPFLFVLTVMTWTGAESGSSFLVSSAGWGLGTLAVLVVVGTLAGVAVIELVIGGRNRQGLDGYQVSGLTVSVVACFVGGLFNILVYAFMPYTLLNENAGSVCGGSGGVGTFLCLHRPGRVLEVLGLTFSSLAILAFAGLCWAGTRSRLCALLSPVLVFGLYLLALRMWLAHEGLGVPDRNLMGG
ncbi:hypothetical protein [Spirillospora sp. CA-128828]|uniref:hypothetical protein n=1 Tax=Spirillospora sp. CA-128828 TaxID=3240033 RepID=UPI003D8A0867